MTRQHHHHHTIILPLSTKPNMNQPSQEQTKTKNRKLLNRPKFTDERCKKKKWNDGQQPHTWTNQKTRKNTYQKQNLMKTHFMSRIKTQNENWRARKSTCWKRNAVPKGVAFPREETDPEKEKDWGKGKGWEI